MTIQNKADLLQLAQKIPDSSTQPFKLPLWSSVLITGNPSNLSTAEHFHHLGNSELTSEKGRHHQVLYTFDNIPVFGGCMFTGQCSPSIALEKKNARKTQQSYWRANPYCVETGGHFPLITCAAPAWERWQKIPPDCGEAQKPQICEQLEGSDECWAHLHSTWHIWVISCSEYACATWHSWIFVLCLCSIILWSWLLKVGNADRNAFGEWQWGAINALLTQFIHSLYPQLSSWANYYSGWYFGFWALGKLVGRCVLKLHCLIMLLASSVGKIISDKPLSWVQSSKDAKRLGARWKVFDVNCIWHMRVWYVPGF